MVSQVIPPNESTTSSMFKGGPGNPYDDIVSEYLLDSLVIADKTTDGNLTRENWELILSICLKVQDEGPEGARNVVAAVLKRLQRYRNPSVQLYALLYALPLADYLFKNCTLDLHRETASRAFTQELEKIITDRTTHEEVKRRALGLIAMWTAEFQNDPSFDCYNALKAKNYKFEAPQEAPPPAVDDEVRWREEEELQRVLEMWNQRQGHSVAGSGSNISRRTSASASGSSSVSAPVGLESNYKVPTYDTVYAPAPSTSLKLQTPVAHDAPTYMTTHSAPSSVSISSVVSNTQVVTHVCALHTFEPMEPGDLAFEKGDIIKVVDRGDNNWWRGQLKGRTGVFPINYVEIIPEPELATEAEQEAVVFAQAVNVDRLLTLLRSLDPAKDDLPDNEEIQELYRSSIALRPKIVKLIDKYSQKRADLVSMNETFVRARSIFDRTMDESLARRTAAIL